MARLLEKLLLSDGQYSSLTAKEKDELRIVLDNLVQNTPEYIELQYNDEYEYLSEGDRKEHEMVYDTTILLRDKFNYPIHEIYGYNSYYYTDDIVFISYTEGVGIKVSPRASPVVKKKLVDICDTLLSATFKVTNIPLKHTNPIIKKISLNKSLAVKRKFIGVWDRSLTVAFKKLKQSLEQVDSIYNNIIQFRAEAFYCEVYAYEPEFDKYHDTYFKCNDFCSVEVEGEVRIHTGFPKVFMEPFFEKLKETVPKIIPHLITKVNVQNYKLTQAGIPYKDKLYEILAGHLIVDLSMEQFEYFFGIKKTGTVPQKMIIQKEKNHVTKKFLSELMDNKNGIIVPTDCNIALSKCFENFHNKAFTPNQIKGWSSTSNSITNQVNELIATLIKEDTA